MASACAGSRPLQAAFSPHTTVKCTSWNFLRPGRRRERKSTPASPTTSPTANTWMFIAVSSFSQKDRGPDSRSLGLSSQPSCSTSMRQPSLSYLSSWTSALVFLAISRIFTASVTDAIRV